MNWALFGLAVYTAFGSVAYIAMVGQPRKAVTPAMAAVVTVISAACIVLLVLAGLRLT